VSAKGLVVALAAALACPGCASPESPSASAGQPAAVQRPEAPVTRARDGAVPQGNYDQWDFKRQDDAPF
jgi:hypothetical protein